MPNIIIIILHRCKYMSTRLRAFPSSIFDGFPTPCQLQNLSLLRSGKSTWSSTHHFLFASTKPSPIGGDPQLTDRIYRQRQTRTHPSFWRQTVEIGCSYSRKWPCLFWSACRDHGTEGNSEEQDLWKWNEVWLSEVQLPARRVSKRTVSAQPAETQCDFLCVSHTSCQIPPPRHTPPPPYHCPILHNFTCPHLAPHCRPQPDYPPCLFRPQKPGVSRLGVMTIHSSQNRQNKSTQVNRRLKMNFSQYRASVSKRATQLSLSFSHVPSPSPFLTRPHCRLFKKATLQKRVSFMWRQKDLAPPLSPTHTDTHKIFFDPCFFSLLYRWCIGSDSIVQVLM